MRFSLYAPALHPAQMGRLTLDLTFFNSCELSSRYVTRVCILISPPSASVSPSRRWD